MHPENKGGLPMPDRSDPNAYEEAPTQIGLPIDLPKTEEKVRLPETPEERTKRRLKEAEAESDDARSKRRATEISRHFDVHMENVNAAHKAHPAPFNSKLVPWDSLTREEQLNWNARSTVIASANKAYNLAVRRTFEEHQSEDAHLARVRKSKQEAA
jgi:hypothetical protein